jgi:hypothetical protein
VAGISEIRKMRIFIYYLAGPGTSGECSGIIAEKKLAFSAFCFL